MLDPGVTRVEQNQPRLEEPGLAANGNEEERFIGWSAVERAVIFGRRDLLPILKPDPARDNFEKLYQSARDAHTVDALAALAPPTNVGSILRDQCRYLDSRCPFPGHYPIEVLEEVFKAGTRWTDSPADEIAWIRRDLLKAKDQDFVELVKLLTHDEYCNVTVLQELGRTPNFRKRLVQVGLLPTPRVVDGRWSDTHRMAGYRNVLAKFGIPVPTPKAPVPRVVEIGQSHANGTTLRLTRRDFYERVWAEPIDVLAKKWGLSGRGLAKACRRARVTVPPRGYWAKVHHSQHPRRPPLREGPDAGPAEIVIHIPPRAFPGV